MLRCPKCSHTYQDETLKFCTNDGSPLLKDGEQFFAGENSRRTPPGELLAEILIKSSSAEQLNEVDLPKTASSVDNVPLPKSGSNDENAQNSFAEPLPDKVRNSRDGFASNAESVINKFEKSELAEAQRRHTLLVLSVIICLLSLLFLASLLWINA